MPSCSSRCRSEIPGELVLVGGSQYPCSRPFDNTPTSSRTFLPRAVSRRSTSRHERRPRANRRVARVGSYFSTLGVQAAIGRVFTADDDRVAGAHPIAVASYGFWQRRLGRDAGVPGPIVRISGTAITIVGVAPPGFFGEQVGLSPDLWVPLTMWGQVVPGRNLLQSPGTGWLRMIGRVRPEVSVSAPQPELTQTFRRVVTKSSGRTCPTTSGATPRERSSARARGKRPLDSSRAIWTTAAAGDGRGRRRAAGGVRQHREPAPRAGDRAATRDRCSPGARHEPGATRPAAPDGEPRPRSAWWRGWCGARLAGTRGASSIDICGRVAASAGRRYGRAPARVRRADFNWNGDPVWAGASLALGSSEHRRVAGLSA